MTDHLDAQERAVVAAAALAAGLLIAEQVAARAVRDALFLSAFEVRSLPYVTMAAALGALAGAEAIAVALARRSPFRIVPAAAGLSGALLLVLWALEFSWPRLTAVLVYLHVASFGGALVSGFWSLVNERFDPYTARRVVGRIGTGAAAGGVAGGLLAWAASRLIPVSATLLVLAMLHFGVFAVLLRTSPRRTVESRSAAPAIGLSALLRAPYLREISVVVLLGALAEAVFDFLFKAEAQRAFQPGGPLLAAFAAFHGGMSVLSLALQVFASRVALQSLGIAGTLALRPLLLVAGSALGALAPRLATATIARGAHEALTNSLFRSAYELLYTPVPEGEKRRVKALVDVAVDKVGTLLGAGVIAVLLALLPAGAPRVLYVLAGAASLAGLFLTRRLHQAYVRTLERSLVEGRVRLDPGEVVDRATQLTLAHSSLFDRATLLRQIEAQRAGAPSGQLLDSLAGLPLASVIEAGEPHPDFDDEVTRAVRGLRSRQPGPAVARVLRESSEPDRVVVAALLPLLADDACATDAVRALRRAAPRCTGQLVDALLDPATPPAVRRRVPSVLKACPTPRAAEGLIEALREPSFELRVAAAAALAALHERSTVVRLSREQVLGLVRRELDSGQPVDRQLPQLYALLSLALDREPLRIAWAAMMSADRALRGTALEYLHNVLPDDVFPRLRSVFGASSGVPLPPLPAPRPVAQVADDLRASAVGLRIEQPPWREGES
jgi:hypothetical protein